MRSRPATTLFRRVARRNGRLDDARHAVARAAATSRRSTPTPKATKASSTSGRRDEVARAARRRRLRACSRARFGLDRAAELRRQALASARRHSPTKRSPRELRHRRRRSATHALDARAPQAARRARRSASGPAATRRCSRRGTASRSRGMARGRARARPTRPRRVRDARRRFHPRSSCGATAACSPRTRTAARASPPISTTTRSCSTRLLELLQSRWRSADLQFATRARRRAARRTSRIASAAASSSPPTITSSSCTPKPFSDEAVPAGNGVAAQALTRLGLLLGETRYLDAAARTCAPRGPPCSTIRTLTRRCWSRSKNISTPPEIVIVRGATQEAAQLARRAGEDVFATTAGVRDRQRMRWHCRRRSRTRNHWRRPRRMCVGG